MEQPRASGVFEEVSAIVKDGGTDKIGMYNGAQEISLYLAANITAGDIVDATQVGVPPYNMSIKIGNTVYIRKFGSTNRIGISGVQVDA